MVVGSTHQGALGRVLPGSVGEKLLQGAPCAVAVAPVGFAEIDHFGSGPIGVGYTGSPESREALSWAESLARQLGSGLRLITAIREFNPAHRPGLLRAPDYRRFVRDDVAKAQAAAAEEIKDIEVEGVIVDGDPAEVLAQQGVELDLLVVGSRGMGPCGALSSEGCPAGSSAPRPAPWWSLPVAPSANRKSASTPTTWRRRSEVAVGSVPARSPPATS